MANFKLRQDDLRKDLRSMLFLQFSNNRSALAGELNVIPKVLRDFLSEGVYMQAKTYNNVIEKLVKLPFELHSFGIGDCVRCFQDINISDSKNVETLLYETFELKDVESMKLMKYFLEGGSLEEIKGFQAIHEDYNGHFS